MPKVIKPSNPLRMFAGFPVSFLFLRRHKFWLHQTDFLLPNSRNEEMMGEYGFYFGATAARFVLNSKRL